MNVCVSSSASINVCTFSSVTQGPGSLGFDYFIHLSSQQLKSAEKWFSQESDRLHKKRYQEKLELHRKRRVLQRRLLGSGENFLSWGLIPYNRWCSVFCTTVHQSWASDCVQPPGRMIAGKTEDMLLACRFLHKYFSLAWADCLASIFSAGSALLSSAGA